MPIKIPYQLKISIFELLKLREFKNSLITDIDDISFTKLEKDTSELKDILNNVVEKEKYLFSKDGYLERYAIDGIDQYCNKIPESWLADEKYEIGQNFSGKSAKPDKNSTYGSPYYYNQLDTIENKEFKYGKDYKDTLGFLKCGISVPLDGTHRTFGTLEVLNKLDDKDCPNENLEFTEEEICWLIILGGHLGRAIYRIRKMQEERLIAKVVSFLSQKSVYYDSREQVHECIGRLFLNPLSPYKAYILRMLKGKELVSVQASSTDDIHGLYEKSKRSRKSGEGIVGQVYETGKYIVKHYDENPQDFKSGKWIYTNGLKSFICFPLIVDRKTIGTLSLFTGYKHQFSDSDIDFITNASHLVAAYMVGLDEFALEKADEENEAHDYIEKQSNLFEQHIKEISKNLDNLGKYVLFEDGRVLDRDDDKLKLLKRAYKAYGNKPMFIEKVSTRDDYFLEDLSISIDRFL